MAMAAPSTRSPRNAGRGQRESIAVTAEIAAIEAEIRAGHPDLQGLCLALSDWSGELRLIERDAR